MDTDNDIDEISHIREVLDIIDGLDGRIIIGFDWDNCISLINGCNLPLRDSVDDVYNNGDGDLVLRVFEELNQAKIPFFVMTSRLKGYSLDDFANTDEYFPGLDDWEIRRSRTIECVKRNVRSMHRALPFLSPEEHNNPLPGLNPREPEVVVHKRHGIAYASSIIFENIIFAGSHGGLYRSNKGFALINYMILGILPAANKFDHFIFVDNDMMHVNNIIHAFDDAGIRDKLIILYYPQHPELNMQNARNLCMSSTSLKGCLAA